MLRPQLPRIWLIIVYCQALFLTFHSALTQPTDAFAPAKTSVLVLYDSSDPYGTLCFHQTLITLRYGRIPYRSLDLAKTSSLCSLDEFSSVLITTEMIWKISASGCSELEAFVHRGGGLAVLFRGWNPELGRLFGVHNRTTPEVDTARSQGLIFTKEFLPGIEGVSINDVLLTDISSFAVDLDSADNVFATTWKGRYPVAWLRRFGAGTVVFWNTSLLSEKIYRGFITGTLGIIQPWTAALIMDLSTVCLDDFPLPSSSQKPEPIKSEFDETSTQFYYLRWYPDMMELSRSFGIKYTTALIFNYAEMTSPPYTFVEWSRTLMEVAGKPINAAVWTARQDSRENEMGLHGHNHLPLTLANWGTETNMELALKAAKRRWEMDNLGPEPTSYIPPMNVIDSVGMDALLDVFPKIGVVAGQYLGRFELGQRREFGQDPWNKNITDIPRMTSGYVMDDFNRMETISMIHSVGAWNHFVHPDDVIPTPGRYQENVREDENLDAAGWYDKPKDDGLYYRLRTWLQFVKDYYPWLRSETLSEARDIVVKYAATASDAVSHGNKIQFSTTKTPSYFMLYLPGTNTVRSIDGGKIIHDEKMEFSKYYILECEGGRMVVTLQDAVPAMNFKGPEQGELYHLNNLARNDVPVDETLRQSPEELPKKKPAVKVAKPDLQRADDLIGEGKQREAIILLERLVQHRPNDTRIWVKLRQLYDLNNKPAKALKALETLVRLEPNDVATMKTLAQRYVWANRLTDALHINERILQREPNDVALVRTLAEENVALNRQSEAILLYEKILRKEPQNVALRNKLAELYFWNGKNNQGIEEYEHILQLNKSDTSLMRSLAQKYLEVDRQKDALRMYERLLVHRPRDVELRNRLAQLYTWNNEGKKAIQQYQEILVMNANDLQTRKTLARLYVENNDPDSAINQLKVLTRLDPNDIASLKSLGELCVWRERQKEAIPVYEKIVAREPDSISYRVMLGQLYAWNKNPRAARRQLNEVLHRDPANTNALGQLADMERGNGEWYLARNHYLQLLAVDARNKEARAAVDDIRREHGLLFNPSYERTEDSNQLMREQVPVAAGLFQTEGWGLGVQAVRQNILDKRLAQSEIGYGLGLNGKYSVGQHMALSAFVLATSYTSGWVPLSLGLQANNTLTPQLYSTLKLRRTETTEGVQAVKSKILLNSATGELFFQTTERLSLSGMAEGDFYSDNNSKMTVAGFSTYKLIVGTPTITLLANYAYQDSKVIYPSSIPYWTPSKLSTTSIGTDVTVGLFESLSIEAAYLNTLQAGVFSNNVRAQITWHPTMFSEVSLYYEKLGSKVYSQNTFRAVIQYRY
jgi:predicted Zn-dependent protease